MYLGYDGTKTLAQRYGVGDGILLHFIGAWSAAFTMTLISAPADILVTRYQTAPVLGLRYNGVADCARALVREQVRAVLVHPPHCTVRRWRCAASALGMRERVGALPPESVA